MSYYSTYSTPSIGSSNADLGAVIVGIVGAFAALFVVIGIVAVVVMVARWQIFKKAGRKPWEALIPVHSTIIEMELGGMETYWYFLNLATVIPGIGWLGPVVFSFWKNILLAKAFGKGTGFGILLTLVPFVGYPMLGFGNAEYQGIKDAQSAE